VTKSTNQQDINDPNKITKPGKEEWDQMDTGLATYGQNGERNRAEKSQTDIVQWSHPLSSMPGRAGHYLTWGF
jgi:hypothetical protein